MSGSRRNLRVDTRLNLAAPRRPAAEVMAAQIVEDDLLAQIRRLCAALKLLCYHTHDSRHSESGFPDLVIVGPRGCLFRELKTVTGTVSVTQQLWIDALRALGMDVGVWRPGDLISQRIANELVALR